MENLREIWDLIRCTFKNVFKSFKRSLLILLLIVAGHEDLTLIFYYLVPCLCFQLMFFNSFDKESFKTLLFYTLGLIGPVIVLLMVILLIVYGISLYLPDREYNISPYAVLAVDSMSNLLNIALSFVFTATFAVSAILTNVNNCSVDNAINFLMQTIHLKSESRIPLAFLVAITFIMMSLDISVYGSVPFVCTWVMFYVFDTKPKRKERKELKFVENF